MARVAEELMDLGARTSYETEKAIVEPWSLAPAACPSRTASTRDMSHLLLTHGPSPTLPLAFLLFPSRSQAFALSLSQSHFRARSIAFALAHLPH
eukprot:1115181-Pleurochrysis_carterae.AAC.1